MTAYWIAYGIIMAALIGFTIVTLIRSHKTRKNTETIKAETKRIEDSWKEPQ